MLMVGLTFPALLAHLKLFSMFANSSLVLSSMANKFRVISKFYGVWYFTYAGYCFFASLFILNTSTKACIPVVSSN